MGVTNNLFCPVKSTMKNSITVDLVSWMHFWPKLVTILNVETFDEEYRNFDQPYRISLSESIHLEVIFVYLWELEFDLRKLLFCLFQHLFVAANLKTTVLIMLSLCFIWKSMKNLHPRLRAIRRHIVDFNDVIMSAVASQITKLTIVCSTVYAGVEQRKHQSTASLAFVRGIHRWPVNSPHKGPVTQKKFPFDDVIMLTTYLYVLLTKSL